MGQARSSVISDNLSPKPQLAYSSFSCFVSLRDDDIAQFTLFLVQDLFSAMPSVAYLKFDFNIDCFGIDSQIEFEFACVTH